MKGCSNQSRLNKNVSFHKIPGQDRKDIRDAWIRAIARPVLPKVVDVCSDYFTEDLFHGSQELKQRLLGIDLNHMRSHPYFQTERPLINQDQVLFICSFEASFQETKISMIEPFLTQLQAAEIVNTNSSKIKF